MRAREKTSFQVFLVSRFLTSIIIVVMMEYLVFFLAGRLDGYKIFGNTYIALIALMALFTFPLVIVTIWFCKIVMNEVHRRNDEQEAIQHEYERKRNLMLSDIAHDLRTPITTIAGYSKALNDGMVKDEQKKAEYLLAIENKSKRMSDLITLLFDYIKMDSENFGLKRTSCDIAEVLRKNAALLYADVEDKGMELVVEIPEEACIVSVDELQISRVITNIINNSLRHNPRGTEIMLELAIDGNEKQIIISDNGEEIEEEVALHIFEPFVVGDKSRRTKGGSGLGLSIAKKVVDMHGWELSLVQNTKRYKKAFVINIK